MLIVPTQTLAVSDIIGKADSWLQSGQRDQPISENETVKILLPIGRVLFAIAVIVLLVVGTIMGIKYIISTPDQQAKLKQQLIGLVVSAVVIFGAYGIWYTIYKFMKDLIG